MGDQIPYPQVPITWIMTFKSALFLLDILERADVVVSLQKASNDLKGR